MEKLVDDFEKSLYIGITLIFIHIWNIRQEEIH